jgi:hypothetical protein
MTREAGMAIYELRQYKVKKGRMKQWVKLFEEQIVPFQVSHGMVVPGSFTAIEKTDQFVWLRRFKNEAERTRLYDRVYKSEHWKKVLVPRVDAVLDRAAIVTTLMSPTAKSVLQ